MFFPMSMSAMSSLGQYDFGYGVRMLQHVLVGLGCSDAGYDTLADAGQDGLLAGSSDQLLDVGAHGHPGLGYHLYAVLCHGCHGRCVDDLGVDGHLHGLEYITAGQVDGGSHLEVQGNVGLVGGDEGVHHVGNIALCQIMRLESIGVQFQAGFRAGHHSHDDGARGYFSPSHQHELDERDSHSRYQGLEPQGHREEPQEDNQGHDGHGYPDQ